MKNEKDNEMMYEMVENILSQYIPSIKPLPYEESQNHEDDVIIDLALKFRQYCKNNGYTELASLPLNWFVGFMSDHIVTNVSVY